MGTQTGVRDLHIDKILSKMAIGFFQGAGIANDIAPIVGVDKQSDLYDIFSRSDALRVEDTRRSPDTEARKIARSVSSGSFYAENYALKYPVTIEDKANMDASRLQHLYGGRAQFLTEKLNLDWEARLAGQVTSTSNVGSSAGVSSEWDGGGADVIGDVNVAIDNVHDLTAQRPNTLLFGLDAWRSLRRSDDIRNLIFGSNNGGGYPNTAQIANIFEVDKILVGGAYQNTANEAQAESLAKVWLDHCIAYYAPASPSRETPSFMYSFRWERPGIPNMQVERHPFDTRRKSEELEVGYYQDEVITGAEYSFMLIAVNSST